MRRELKFRVWSEYGEKFLDYFDYKFGDALRCDCGSLITEVVEFDDICIVEQYTGLKDKNGKEIYEGDFVRQFDYEEYFVVKFEYGGFLPFTADMLTFDIDYCEVIGNIHENPELLGGEQ